MPTFWLQCRPNEDQNFGKVRIVDLMPTLRTFLATLLLYMWGVRAIGNTVDLNTTRSVLEGRINLLRNTRFRNEYQVLKEIIEI